MLPLGPLRRVPRTEIFPFLRLVLYEYDANGNLTADDNHTYTWDRANRLTGMGGLAYVYDGAGIGSRRATGWM